MNQIARKLFATLLVLFAFIFFCSAVQSVVAQIAKPSPSPNKCAVCHNGHTVQIDCDQVTKYLQKHPGDYAGVCQGVTQEKP